MIAGKWRHCPSRIRVCSSRLREGASETVCGERRPRARVLQKLQSIDDLPNLHVSIWLIAGVASNNHAVVPILPDEGEVGGCPPGASFAAAGEMDCRLLEEARHLSR